MKPTSIQDHGLIGNMRSAALVSTSGAIDFFCFPEFDSPSVFASLLDDKIGGSFALRPKEEEYSVKQLYVPETNLLLTRFLAEEGIAELCDFMPLTDNPDCHGLMRQLTVVHGTMSFRLRCSPSFDYARSSHVAQSSEDGVCLPPRAIRVHRCCSADLYN